MGAAIFGLVGVVVGAVVTGAVNAWGEWRQRRADVRQARRLIAEDLRLIVADLELMAELGHYPVMFEHFLPTAAWSEHRGVLARELDDEIWSQLAAMMTTVSVVATSAKMSPAGSKIPDAARQQYAEGIEHFGWLYEELTGRKASGQTGARAPS